MNIIGLLKQCYKTLEFIGMKLLLVYIQLITSLHISFFKNNITTGHSFSTSSATLRESFCCSWYQVKLYMI
ncbi:MAG: hypothetical protein Q8786_00520 [Sweet potato little leaf phytoplasma]|nr:hypothetical protein [Sweet potato little leaf phytoplasma]